jgi:predicted amidophosphoribosyltransferase
MGQRITTICKTCGKEMKISPAQGRKKMCTECAYEIKKIRSSEKYWGKKAPNSTRHKYWLGRYQAMNKMLNK